jgi:hypothetical protein
VGVQIYELGATLALFNLESEFLYCNPSSKKYPTVSKALSDVKAKQNVASFMILLGVRD